MMEELGSGFYLAMHDLEIRGAGEVLGEEQTGEMQEVGFAPPACRLASSKKMKERKATRGGGGRQRLSEPALNVAVFRQPHYRGGPAPPPPTTPRPPRSPASTPPRWGGPWPASAGCPSPGPP